MGENDTALTDRLCLGTAQFGLDYGIANKGGRMPEQEAWEILDYAQNKGLRTLDTAYAYGDSEALLGKFLNNSKDSSEFKIISKMPAVDGDSSKKAKELFRESCVRLNRERLYGYLIHRFDDFLKYEHLWDSLEGLKNEDFVKKVGFSLYRPCELEAILEQEIDFDIIQLPYSVFDRRFEKYFKLLHDYDVEIYVRSVFLQGLAFLKPGDLPQDLNEAKVYLERLRALVSENNVSINALCLNFVLLNPYIDKAIIGVDNFEHLKKNLEALNSLQKVSDIYYSLDKLKIEKEDLLLPYKWKYR